ncbi:hypothetical protein AB431_18295 [Mycobacterium sp. EPa45]|nr:hypothetical protein AB431_18295 [Mycobacterium sp. EPa45]
MLLDPRTLKTEFAVPCAVVVTKAWYVPRLVALLNLPNAWTKLWSPVLKATLPVPKLSTCEPVPKRFTAAEPSPRASALELPIETARFNTSVGAAPA